MASSYQTLSNVYSDVRYNAGKDSNTLADADLLRIANKYYRLMFRELVDLNEDLYAEISSTPLVANQREYQLPVDSQSASPGYGGGLIKLQRVEVSIDGSTWKVADPISLQEIPGPTILDSDINSQFDRSTPKYWFKDRSVFLAPVPGSNDAGTTDPANTNLRIYWIKRPYEMASSSELPDLPNDFLSVLTEGMLMDVFRKYGRVNDMRLAQSNWLAGIAKMREMEAKPVLEEQLIIKRALKNYY